MKKIATLFYLLANLTSFGQLPITYQPVPGDTSGYIMGDFNVTDGGSAVYNIALQVSPGTGGIAPKLSLAYNSQSGNGLLGVGFSLQGLGVVTATSPTLSQDGFVSQSINDYRYSLEGERLVLVNPADINGGNGVEYRTEQNAFNKVKSFGNLYSNNIPQYFEVKSNSGIISEYGNSTDSRVGVNGSTTPLFWLLNKVYDTKGNYMTITYQNSYPYTGEYYPQRIDYTGNNNAGMAPYASVQFFYEPRPDTIYKSFQGSSFSTTKRLKSIKCFYQNALVREYVLSYLSGTTLSQLQQVQECGVNGQCLTPTLFNWNNNASISFSQFNSNIYGGTYTYNGNTVNEEVIPLDINADGAVDLVKYRKQNGYPVQFYLNRKNANMLLDSVGSNYTINFDGDIAFGDFNGDGKTDIVTYSASGNKIYLNNSNPQFGNLIFTQLNNPLSLSGVQDYTPLIPVDFNADGRSDFLFYDPVTGDSRWFIIDSATTTNIWFKQFGTNSYATNLLPTSALSGSLVPYISDFNNDGLQDIMTLDRNSGVNTFYKNTGPLSVGFSSLGSLLNLTFLNTNYSVKFADINGDGLNDFLFYNQSNGDNRWFLNYGAFTFGAVIQNPGGISTSITGGTMLTPIDFNNDGYADLFWYDESSGNNKWIINASNTGGIKFSQITANAINPGYAAGYNIGGSGNFSTQTNFDFLLVKKNSASNYRYLRSNIFNNVTVSSIQPGNYSTIQLEYSTLTNDSVYTKAVDGLYPIMDYQGPMPVIKRVLSDDGIGNLRGKSYIYKGAKFDITGRGFRGFSEVDVVDEVSGIVQSRYYDRGTTGWKYINSPLVKEEIKLGNGIVVSTTNIKNGLKVFYNGKCHFSYVDKNASYNYELDGTFVDSTITHQEYDDYGNVTTLVTDYGSGYKDSLVNTYYNDPVTWIIGRLTRSQLFRFAPGQAPLVRTSAFEYEIPGSALLTKTITDPDSGNNVKVVKEFTYDSFGNIIQSALTAWNGSALETRTTTTTCDLLGRFTLTNQNALGQTVTRTFDDLTGNMLSETDANGLSHYTQYDAFGRPTKQIFPDGNWETIDYRKCGGAIPCVPNAVHIIYMQSSTEGPSIKYYDNLNREMLTKRTGFDGKWIVQENVFDRRGYMISQSEPHHQDSVAVYTQKQYDLLGRETVVVLPGNRMDSIKYQGKTTIVVNAKGQKKTSIKDAKDNIISVIDDLGNTVHYEYDVSGKPIRTTDPNGNNITIAYDLHGNKTDVTDPDLGHYHYIFNSFDELIYQEDPKHQVTTLEYDLLGRLKTRIDPDGTSTYTYDTQSNGVGKLAHITSYNGYEYDVTYDALSRKVNQKETIDSAVYNIGYLYDSLGRVKGITYPSGYSVTHNFNVNGYLTEIRETATNKLLWQGNHYDAQGLVDDQSFGNGLNTIREYDPVTRFLIGIYTSNSNTVFQNLKYSYDVLGNLLQRKDNISNHQEIFSYDDLNRLTKSKTTGGDSVVLNYDLMGNITYKSDVGLYNYGTVNAGPHRLISITQTTNQCIPSLLVNTEFNAFNKIHEISKDSLKVDVFYNAMQQRTMQKMFFADSLVRKKIYVGGFFEKEFKNNLTKETNYVYGPEGVIATYETYSNGTSKLNFWHKDHLGSLVMLTNDSAQVIYKASFDPWGKRLSGTYSPLADSIALAFERGFTGHEHYDLFDLIDMNGRLYDPVIGRFLSPDPYIQDFSNLQNLNRYSYVLNNPLSYIDPSGYFGLKDIWKAASGAISSAFHAYVSFYGNIIKGVSDVAAKAIKESAKWVKENWKTIAIITVAVGVGMLTGGIGGPFVGAILSGAASGFAASMTASMLNGNSFSQSLRPALRSAAIGAVSAGATYGIGEAAQAAGTSGGNFTVSGMAIKIIGHGLVQGEVAELNHDKFEHGFYAGAFTAAAAPVRESMNYNVMRVSSAAVVGGTASVIGGGKFSNGAVTGAYVELYNDGPHRQTEEELNQEIEQYNLDTHTDRESMTVGINPIGGALVEGQSMIDNASAHFDSFKNDVYEAIKSINPIIRIQNWYESQQQPTPEPSPVESPGDN